MKDKEMIEEMAKVIIESSCQGKECENCAWSKSVAEAEECCVCLKALYNAGYRKLPKDSVVNTPTIQCETYSQNNMVVLSREELEEKYEPNETFMAVARELEELKQNLEDKVVLSKEEYERLLKIKEEASVKETNYFSNLFKLQKELEQVEKERDSAIDNCNRKSKKTAEKILNFGKKFFKNHNGHYNEGFCLFMAWIETQIENGYFAKQFGVKIK